MFLVDPKDFRFVVKGVKVIFLGGSKRVGVTIESYGKLEILYINVVVRGVDGRTNSGMP